MKASITENDLHIIRAGLAEFLRAGHPDAVAKDGKRALELLRMINLILRDDKISEIKITA